MRAAIYARSSKERRDVSVPSQVEELKALAKAEGDLMVRVFKDKAESAKSDDRPAFQEMIALAKSKDRPFERVYCYDTSRFSRRREHAAAYKTILKKAGVELVFLKLPKSDSYLDGIIEGVFEVFDEFHSMKSKADGLRGMRQNAKKGYRAGGSAPYGYRLIPAYEGTNAEGGPVIKNKLEPDPETAPVAREYFERRAIGESRSSILRDFNKRGLRPPRGNTWRQSTGHYMEQNTRVYLGHLIWNRHQERIDGQYVGGSKYRNESEWVVSENAHEAIISEDIASKVKALSRNDGRGWHGRRESSYTLSGVLYCAKCRERLTGNAGFYACAGRKRLDGHKCRTAKISQGMIEREVVRVIKEEFIRPEYYAVFIKSAREQLRTDQNRASTELNRLRNAKEKAKRGRERWVGVYEEEHPGWETALERIGALECDIKDLECQILALETKFQAGVKIAFSDAHFRDLLDRFDDTIGAGSIYERRNLIGEVIERIDLGPKVQRPGRPWERDCSIFLRVPGEAGVKVASPRGFEPLLPA